MVGKGQKKILLNLGEVSYIDSSGIGRVGVGLHHGDQRGRTVESCLNLTKRVKRLLQITKGFTPYSTCMTAK